MSLKQYHRKTVLSLGLVLLLSSCHGNFIPSFESNYCTGEWGTCKLFTENKLAMRRGTKWGYVGKANKQMIDFKFDNAAAFANGIAVVRIGSWYNVIDAKGKTLIKNGYDRLFRDVDDRVLIYRRSGKYGLLNESGKEITPANYDGYVGEFSDDRLAVRIGDKYGYISKTGHLIINPIYEDAYKFTQGLALVKQNGFYGFINKQGTMVIPATFTDGYSFDEFDRAIVQIDDTTFGLIDKSGTVLVTASDINGSGPLYEVELANGDQRLYSYTGTPFTPTKYNYINIYGPYLANVEWNDESRYYDDVVIFSPDGTMLVNVRYSNAKPYTSGDNIPYIRDNSNDQFKLKSVTLEIELTGITNIEQITSAHIVVNNGTKIGAMTLEAESQVAIPLIYDNVLVLPDNYAVVRQDAKIGVVAMDGSSIIPIEYDDFTFFANL